MFYNECRSINRILNNYEANKEIIALELYCIE